MSKQMWIATRYNLENILKYLSTSKGYEAIHSLIYSIKFGGTQPTCVGFTSDWESQK